MNSVHEISEFFSMIKCLFLERKFNFLVILNNIATLLFVTLSSQYDLNHYLQ